MAVNSYFPGYNPHEIKARHSLLKGALKVKNNLERSNRSAIDLNGLTLEDYRYGTCIL